MCVIIIKQKDNIMSSEIAKTSARINPHGLGIVWLDTFEVEYYESEEYKRLLTDRPFIAHFRYATIGKVNNANMHPFVCGRNKDELLMHNGTIKGYGDENTPDSKALAIHLGTIERRKWKQELEQYDSRFVSINTRTRSFQIYNRNLYTYRDGIWYSKSNVIQDNLVAVYGTLKKGFNNYYNYLTSSKHIGTGRTQDKYPLIVEGLPFLINKKGVGHNVKVDVFKVSDATFKNLDILEGHPRWYKREQIPVTLSNGKVYNCWIYFCPKTIKSNTILQESYEQSSRHRIKEDVTEDVSHQAIDIGWDDNDFPTEATQTCVDCYGDVEYDGFSNYYCSSCGGWFKEDEVLKFQN